MRVLQDPTARSRAAEAARGLAVAWSWPEVARPLVRFCLSPRRAPDLSLAPVDRQVLSPWSPRGRPGPVERVRGAWGEGGWRLAWRRARGRLGRLVRRPGG